MMGGPIDLVTVDGRVARAQKSLEREIARLGTEEGRETARSRDPFEGVRDVAGQSTFKALRELEPGPIHAPHRDGLLRWVHELLQQRVAWDLLLDEADALHALDPTLSARVVNDEKTTIVRSFDEARRALINAPTAAAAGTAFDRLADLATPVAAVRREQRSRRYEVARRLGLDHPWALATSMSIAELGALGRAILDATEPLARELHKDLQRRAESGPTSPALVIEDAFARDAREGWPARLAVRWLEDVFRAIAPRPPRAVTMPPALGGTSFLRAAASWGAALRLGSVARTLPFALARDPYPIEAHVFGNALALAVAGPPFAKRKLGLPARSADAHARALHRALFIALRVLAAELLGGLRADDAEELSARVFGVPLPASLSEAWSFGGFSGRSRIDAPARLVAAVRGYGFTRDLIDRFDEDWFDNPRAGRHLASVGAGPVWPARDLARGEDELSDVTQVRPIARAFEEMLG